MRVNKSPILRCLGFLLFMLISTPQDPAFACEKELKKPLFLSHDDWVNCPLRQKPPKEHFVGTEEERRLWKPPFKKVDSSLYISELYELDHKSQTFRAQGAVSMTWNGMINSWDGKPSEMPQVDILGIDLEQFYLSNADEGEYSDAFYEDVNGNRNHTVYFDGTISANFNYKKFPFDSQNLVISYEGWSDAYHYIFNQENIPTFSANFNKIKNYDIAKVYTSNAIKVYPTTFGVPDYEPWETYSTSSVQTIFVLKKSIIDSFFKFILPLMVICLLLLINASKHSTDRGVKLSLPPASLLAMIFLQTETTSALPALSYLTFLDYLFVFGYVLVFVCFVEALFVHNEKFSDEQKYFYLLRRRCLVATMFGLTFLAPIITFFVI